MKRPIRIDGDVAYVPLTRGYEAVIDAADVPLVAGRNWTALVQLRADKTIRTVYAQRSAKNPAGKVKSILMHRLICGVEVWGQTDHIDGNGLNNRKSNLRMATHAQNQHNQRVSSRNTSGVKGVDYCKKYGKWRALIQVRKKRHYLGMFTSRDDAARAYAEASVRFHGEFGRAS